MRLSALKVGDTVTFVNGHSAKVTAKSGRTFDVGNYSYSSNGRWVGYTPPGGRMFIMSGECNVSRWDVAALKHEEQNLSRAPRRPSKRKCENVTRTKPETHSY